jgi:Tfp pilus assembly protein PilV
MLKEDGFTLLEVLIAVLLFTVGVVAIIGLFSAGLISSIDAENTAIAMNLARARMEEIRNKDFTLMNNEAKGTVGGFPGFQREVLVTTTLADLKQVMVNVYWTFKGGETDVSFTTYISKN